MHANVLMDNPDNTCWRSHRWRSWAPMNFLVYLYDLPNPRQALVEKLEALLRKKGREYGHVHEEAYVGGDRSRGCLARTFIGFPSDGSVD
jgi:hypothetical protein